MHKKAQHEIENAITKSVEKNRTLYKASNIKFALINIYVG